MFHDAYSCCARGGEPAICEVPLAGPRSVRDRSVQREANETAGRNHSAFALEGAAHEGDVGGLRHGTAYGRKLSNLSSRDREFLVVFR